MPQITMSLNPTNLKGTCCTLDMIDGAVPLENGMIDRHGFSFIDDSNAFVIDQKGWYVPADRGDAKDLYFFGYLSDHTACLRDYYEVHRKDIHRIA